MSIWCSYPTIGWDDLGDPEPGWSSGELGRWLAAEKITPVEETD